MIDLDALEAKARAASNRTSPWRIVGDLDDVIAHIAAFDPPTTLALIARIRDLEAALAPFAHYAKKTGLDEEGFEGEVGEQYHGGLRVSIHLRDLREAARISKEAADGK